jgi:hypothetical protein
VNVTPLTNLEARKRPLDSGGAKKKIRLTPQQSPKKDIRSLVVGPLRPSNLGI